MNEARLTAERVGDLLIRSELISVELLEDAVNISERMSISLGRALEMNGYVSEQAVQQALLLQEKLDRGELSMANAVRVMEAIARQGIELESALRQLQIGDRRVSKQQIANKVGDLMSAAGIISPQQLNRGIYDSLNTGLPLGMVLVEKEIVLPTVLEWCLSTQKLIAGGKISAEQGAQALRFARFNGTDLKNAFAAQGLPAALLDRTFAINDLLLAANSITQTQLLAARELELENDKPLEEILVDCGVVSKTIVGATQHLLQMIQEGVFSIDQAAKVVRKLCASKSIEEMEQIFNNISSELARREPPTDLLELIAIAHLLSPELLAKAIIEARQTKKSLLAVLSEGTVIDKTQFESAQQCKRAIDAGAISLTQGVIALTYASDEQVPFSEALGKFGWERAQLAVAP